MAPSSKRAWTPEGFEMNSIRGGALSLLASFALALSGSAVFAQSTDGIFDTIKGMVGDPALGSMLMSKFASPSAILGGGTGGAGVGGGSNGGSNGNAYGMGSGFSNAPYTGLPAYGALGGPGMANAPYNGPATYGMNGPAAANLPYNAPGAYDMSNNGPMGSSATPYANGYGNSYSANAPGAAYAFASPQPSANRSGLSAAKGALASLATNYFNAGSGGSGIGQVMGTLGLGNDPSRFQQANLAQIPAMGSPMVPPQSVPGSASSSDVSFSMRIAPSELRQLSRYDISVLIDKSGSMNTRDCPALFGMGQNVSRWEWCREQSAMLSEQTAGAFPAGISLVPFSSNFQRFDNVRPEGINSIFNTSSPGGSTNLAGALQAELGRYFQDRDMGARNRPLMIAVITDGVPDSKSAVRRVIREATQNMRDPSEIKIVFFMIGQDQGGADFVDTLTDGLGRDGQNFKIVSEHSFAEVNQLGLPRSLAFSAIQ